MWPWKNAIINNLKPLKVKYSKIFWPATTNSFILDIPSRDVCQCRITNPKRDCQYSRSNMPEIKPSTVILAEIGLNLRMTNWINAHQMRKKHQVGSDLATLKIRHMVQKLSETWRRLMNSQQWSLSFWGCLSNCTKLLYCWQ